MDTISDAPEFLTAAEAAVILRTKTWAVTAACRTGEIRATKPGKTWLIERVDLQAYIERGRNAYVGAAS